MPIGKLETIGGLSVSFIAIKTLGALQANLNHKFYSNVFRKVSETFGENFLSSQNSPIFR